MPPGCPLVRSTLPAKRFGGMTLSRFPVEPQPMLNPWV
jgi:hypothetical protein